MSGAPSGSGSYGGASGGGMSSGGAAPAAAGAASGHGAAPAAGGAPPAGAYIPSMADIENIKLTMYLFYIWIAILAFMLLQRIVVYTYRHNRRIVSMGNEKQRYFAEVNERLAKYKRYWEYAPLLRKRHNREFMLSSAINVGTLPTRIQTALIVGYLATNVVFCVIWLDYSATQATLLTQLRNRSGILSVANMIPLFIFAGRNNFLIKLLGISFDTYNLLHRWLGRIAVIEAVVHTAAYCTNKVHTSGWETLWKSMASSKLILTGTIGTCAFVFLLLQSPSAIRHAYYEVFLHVHIAVAVTAVVVIWMHLDGIPSQALLLGAIVAWIIERLIRVKHIIRNNVGAGGTHAEVEAMPGDAMRVTLRLARPWKFQPGQHVYLYMPTIGFWMNHPFSLAWSDDYQDVYSEKELSMERQDIMSIRKTTMSLVIRRRTGFTDALWKRAEKSPNGRFVAPAFVEGPYGSQNLNSYGTVMLFAGGVGITHQVPFLRELVGNYANGTCATRRVTLVWIIQSPEHLEWIRPWMTDILGMEKRRDILRILLFITRPRSTKEIHSPSASVQMFPGKPDVSALISQQQQNQVGAMAVSVCGTGSLSDDVRRAVRMRSQKTTIDFVENAFSW